MPPPPPLARLPETRTRRKVTSRALFSRPPPSNARLLLMVLSAIRTSSALWRLRAPPSSVASAARRAVAREARPPRQVVRESRVEDRVLALAVGPDATALAVRLVLGHGHAGERHVRPTFARDRRAVVGGVVLSERRVGDSELRVAVVEEPAAVLGDVLEELRVLHRERAAEAVLRDVAAAVEAAAVRGLVLGDGATGDGDLAALGGEAAASGRGAVLGDRRVRDLDDAVALVEDPGAAALRCVQRDGRVRDLERANLPPTRLVRDRARGDRVVRGVDEDELLRVERIRHDRPRVERDHAPLGDRDRAARDVVDRRAAAAGRAVARERRALDLDPPVRQEREIRRLGRPRVVVQVGVVETAASLLGIVVLDRDAVERQLAERPVLDRPAFLGAKAVLERDVLERDIAGPGVDLKQAVDPARDDGRARKRIPAVDDDGAEVTVRLLDCDGIEDLEITDVGRVLVDRGDRYRVGAGKDVDDVRTRLRVRLLGRRAQRAGAGGRLAHAVADVGVDGVDRAVYYERQPGGARETRGLQAQQHGECRGDGEKQSYARARTLTRAATVSRGKSGEGRSTKQKPRTCLHSRRVTHPFRKARGVSARHVKPPSRADEDFFIERRTRERRGGPVAPPSPVRTGERARGPGCGRRLKLRLRLIPRRDFHDI